MMITMEDIRRRTEPEMEIVFSSYKNFDYELKLVAHLALERDVSKDFKGNDYEYATHKVWYSVLETNWGRTREEEYENLCDAIKSFRRSLKSEVEDE